MKFYQAEMEAHDFMKGDHTLREWASYGFNKVAYNDNVYYDGMRDGNFKITDKENDEAGLLTWTQMDFDEDGFIYLVLDKVENVR